MTRTETQKKTQAVQLNAQNPDQQVVITPPDQDRFVISCKKAIEACVKHHQSEKLMQADIAKMIQHCRGWVSEHADLVGKSYVAPHGYKIVFYVAPPTEGFSFDLAEKVADLSYELKRTYQAVSCDAMAIPGGDDEAVKAFVDIETAFPMGGHGQREQPS